MALTRTAAKLGRRLRREARVDSEEVEQYLARNSEQWEEIAREDPPDAADIVEEIRGDAAMRLIRDLEPPDAADVLEQTRPDVAARLITDLPPQNAAAVLARMSTQKAADVLGEVSEPTRAALMGLLPAPFSRELSALLRFPKDSAGGVMVTRVASCAPRQKVDEVVAEIRGRTADLEESSTLFVVGAEGKLVGTVQFRSLVFAAPDRVIEELMRTDPVTVTAETDRERAAILARRYDLESVPVVDGQGRLIGAITRAVLLETAQEEASEDFAVASGAGREETVFSRVSSSVRMRLPWLFGNLLMALAIVFAVERQKGVIDRYAVLAALMPLVAQVGGNAGAQSLAVVIRGFAMDAVGPQRVMGILSRQLGIGLVNGLMIGIAGGVIGTIVGELKIGVVVALGALANLVVGSFAGAGIPILLRKFGLDPALASNIFLSLLTDLVGFGGFLIIATLLL